ncbi:hypothetical protein [Streptomyces roseolilacinus]|uniref:Uncharacterized protein n=1 Tax=Streptomyces roseolilacinus TaxID=66904 RepID=A0A918AWJ2_9ACTN|nr:hypothetical protein [Streptomyces roseolilacinus]GGP93467.1 hypothetical protein GCM10010249_08890 [Streptomyces roseolilacinus]
MTGHRHGDDADDHGAAVSLPTARTVRLGAPRLSGRPSRSDRRAGRSSPDQPNARLSGYLQNGFGSSTNGMTATVAESPERIRAYSRRNAAP